MKQKKFVPELCTKFFLRLVSSKRRGATKRKSNHKSRTNGIFSRNITLWFGGGILIGVIIMGFIASNWLTILQSNPNTSIAQQETKTAAKPISPPPKQSQGSSKFDFYTLLPKMGSSNQNTQTKSKSSSRTLDIKQSAPSYVVQVGSFKNIADAEQLKARLTLQGYSAHYSHVRLKSGQRWHRVSVGPFKNHRQALEQQKLLEKDNFSGTLLVLQQG